MMKSKCNPPAALAFAERCKSILGANWQAQLYTVKADAKTSKEDIHSSQVKYIIRRGKPYLWVPEGDLHNVNTIIDERGSLSVSTPTPGPLMSLLRSVNKFPARVALTGDVIPLRDAKADSAMEVLKEAVEMENSTLNCASYSVSGVLSSANANCKSRKYNFQEIMDRRDNFLPYKFNIRSCTYIDSSGGTYEVEELNEFGSLKHDPLLPFSEKLIDGINQSETRRRALIFFCLVYLNTNARDAFVVSVDSKGVDILAKVPAGDGSGNYRWNELRIPFEAEVNDVEGFCNILVEMEAAVLREIGSFSGLG